MDSLFFRLANRRKPGYTFYQSINPLYWTVPCTRLTATTEVMGWNIARSMSAIYPTIIEKTCNKLAAFSKKLLCNYCKKKNYTFNWRILLKAESKNIPIRIINFTQLQSSFSCRTQPSAAFVFFQRWRCVEPRWRSLNTPNRLCSYGTLSYNIVNPSFGS